MTKYLIQRLVLAIPTILLVTLGVFLLVRVVPGDVATLRLAADATEEEIFQFRQQHGLTDPAAVQYVKWVGNALRGDLGDSFWERRPVSQIVVERFPVTLQLAIMAMTMAILVGIPLGVLSAVKQDSVADQFARFFAVLFIAIPAFWLAILVILLPTIWFGWKPPTGGYLHLWEDPVWNLWAMFWPALVVSASSLALTLRLTRSSMLEVMRQDYIRTARAKGLNSRAVLNRHALRNALIPVVTILGLQLAVLLGGSVIAEQVFVIPGMGRSLLGAIFQRDYPLIQAYVLLFALIYIVLNLAVDILYSVIDPRIRYG
jgi:peptide/nickel transport system permease protein